MMTKDRDYEDILRRALAEAAESIEPTGDGLRRIRHRLDSPRSLRSVFSGCTEWLELHGIRFLIRLDPAIEAARAALSRAQSAWGPLGALAGLLGGRGRRRRAGGHRGAASPPGRLGSAGPWLKPVFAVSAAVAIVAVGVVILNHEKGTLINPANNVGTAEPSSSVASGGTAANSGLPLFIKPGPQSTGPTQNNSATNPVPAVVCTPIPTPTPATTPTLTPTTTAPTGSANPTPTPTVSGTATSTPTTQPTQSGSPTPTTTVSGTTAGATATTTAAAQFVPNKPVATTITECASPAKTP
jgi:hypothetical protein